MAEVRPDRFEDGELMLMAGLRRRHPFTAAADGIVGQWQEFMSGEPVPGRIGDRLFGIMCGADATGVEYMCGVQVESLSELPSRFGRMRIPAQHYAVFVHPGPGSTIQRTWQQVLGWLGTGEYESAHQPDFELYERGVEPVSTAGGVEIWVGVVSKRRG